MIILLFIDEEDYHIPDSRSPITISNSNETVTVRINIQDDQFFEHDESFTISLVLYETSVPGVILNHTTAEVIILDDDSKVAHQFGFTFVVYQACLGGRNVNH